MLMLQLYGPHKSKSKGLHGCHGYPLLDYQREGRMSLDRYKCITIWVQRRNGGFMLFKRLCERHDIWPSVKGCVGFVTLLYNLQTIFHFIFQ